jgi:hypothetical protein
LPIDLSRNCGIIIIVNEREGNPMTKELADKILNYVAEEILSPMILDNRPAYQVGEELTAEPFNKLCKMIYENVENT